MRKLAHGLLLALGWPGQASAQRFVLDTGAVVRAQLETTTVTGEVRQFFTDTSTQLVICPQARQPCADREDRLVVQIGTIKSLFVRGKQTGFFGLLGFYVGALAEMAATRRTDGGLVAGGFGGAALGALIGSKKIGWVPVFPCFHACAAGHFPELER